MSFVAIAPTTHQTCRRPGSGPVAGTTEVSPKNTAMRLLSTTLLLVWLSVAPSWAVADRPHRVEPRLQVAQNDCTSLSEAVERVRRQYNGRIVSAETRVSGNREVHHIKVLTDDGKVKTERVQGCSRRPS